MKEYQVQIKETLAITVTIEAESAAQARKIAELNWKNGDYIINDQHFQGATFTVPARSGRER